MTEHENVSFATKIILFIESSEYNSHHTVTLFNLRTTTTETKNSKKKLH